MDLELEHIPLENKETTVHYSNLKLKAFTPYWHFHPEYELTYILKGKGLRFVGDDIAPFKSGDLVLLGENLPHQWVSDGKDEDVQALIFQFSKTVFSLIPELSVLSEMLNVSNRGLFFSNPSEQVLEKINAYERLGELDKLITFFEILNLLLSEKSELLSSKDNVGGLHLNQNSERVTKVLEFTLDNMYREISLAEVSEFTGMTSPAFCRWFKKSIGKSFITYLNQMRVEKASSLLWNQDLPIAQIAYETGFESLSNFNRSFLKYKKCSPRIYRKQFQVL